MSSEFVPPGYQILHLLGSGQTSFVHLAKHRQRGTVALKLPRPELNEKPLLRRMFENEVQITLSLKNEHVVATYDGFPTGKKAFLVLEYCPGGTLDQLMLEKGSLPLEQGYRLIIDVAKGLEYSHHRHVLHRDVKPANVFLAESGSAKLGDFGTGMYLSERSDDRVGTAFYMAPEIFRGSNATVQSDVYSLGILAYEVLTGQRPFVGNSYDALMMAHLSGLPKNPRHYRAGLPQEVGKVIARAMARDADKRFQSVREFLKVFSATTGMSLSENAPRIFGRAGRAKRNNNEDDKAKGRETTAKGLGRWFGRKKNDS